MRNNENTINIPVWEKYVLSVQEAAVYFRIGTDKLREIAKENKDANFMLWNGNRAYFKRKLFEAYVDTLQYI